MTKAKFGQTIVTAEHKVRPGSTFTVFHYDNGLIITDGGLAIDVRRRQRNGFVSHAHTDHIAPHEVALCTAATGCLYQLRLGSRRVIELPYRQPVDWGNLRLTAYPAGHCLGSAMLLVERDDMSLLYTGDFKLAQPLTCEPAELSAADVLIMECTFGTPRHRMPAREVICATR